METVTLTPAGYDPSNPKSQENIAKGNAAAKRIEEIISQRSDMLRTIVDDYFGGILGVAKSLRKTGEVDEEQIKELITDYEVLLADHDEQTQHLLESLSGR